MKRDNVKHKYVTQDDAHGWPEMLVIPIDDNWGRIILTCNANGKEYRLGVLAPRAKDIDLFVTGARLAGWAVIDERSRS